MLVVSSKAKLYTRFYGDKEVSFVSHHHKEGGTLSDVNFLCLQLEKLEIA